MGIGKFYGRLVDGASSMGDWLMVQVLWEIG